MKIKTQSLFASLFFLGLHGAAHATQTPNFYECTGKNVNLTLSVGSTAEAGIAPAQSTLNLQMGRKNYHFLEEEIMTESTLIGDLWVVTLNMIPDLQIDRAAVVIPTIALGETPVKFSSQLILTRVATPFYPLPYQGIVNASKYIDINCSASLVYY